MESSTPQKRTIARSFKACSPPTLAAAKLSTVSMLMMWATRPCFGER